MKPLARLTLTPLLQLRIAAVREALAMHDPGASYAAIELPKLDLADAVLAAVAAQQAPRLARLAQLPKATPAVVEVTLRPKRRRRA